MLNTAKLYLQRHDAFWPGLAISILVLSLNLFGDGLRDRSILDAIRIF